MTKTLDFQNIKGSDDVLYHPESPGFRSSSIVWNSKQLGNSTFRRRIGFRLEVRGRRHRLSWVSQCLRSALSTGHNTVSVSFLSPEHSNISSFRNFVLSSCLEFRTTSKILEPSDCCSRLSFAKGSPIIRWWCKKIPLLLVCGSTAN
jgi:hypothetical protein